MTSLSPIPMRCRRLDGTYAAGKLQCLMDGWRFFDSVNDAKKAMKAYMAENPNRCTFYSGRLTLEFSFDSDQPMGAMMCGALFVLHVYRDGSHSWPNGTRFAKTISRA